MNVSKEDLFSSVEAYTKTVENQTYDKVLHLIQLKATQLDKILSSAEAYNIISFSTGYRFNRMCEKRRVLRNKMYKVIEIYDDVIELRNGRM